MTADNDDNGVIYFAEWWRILRFCFLFSFIFRTFNLWLKILSLEKLQINLHIYSLIG